MPKAAKSVFRECVGFVAVSFKMVSRLGSGNGQVCVSLDRKSEMHIAGPF